MNKVKKIFSAALLFAASIFICAHADDWKMSEKFNPSPGVYSMKIYESWNGTAFSGHRKINTLLTIRKNGVLEADIKGLSATETFTFNKESDYEAYKKNHAGISFDDSNLSVEQKLLPKDYDQSSSFSDFIDSINSDFMVFESENFYYKLYKKYADKKLGVDIERTCLLEPLILNLEDFVNGSIVPPEEDLAWKKSKSFNPPAGTYDLKMNMKGTDAKTGISADADMDGIISIRGTNSYSMVTIEIKGGQMNMHFTPEAYGEAKSLYKMAYGNAYNYNDETRTISGNIDEDTKDRCNSAMFYKEFTATYGYNVYTDGNGKYKLTVDSQDGLVTLIMKKK